MVKNRVVSARIDDKLYERVMRRVDIRGHELEMDYTVNDYLTMIIKEDLRRNRLL